MKKWLVYISAVYIVCSSVPVWAITCDKLFSAQNSAQEHSLFHRQALIANEAIKKIEARNLAPINGAFGPQSIIWKIFGERSIAITLPRMGIMQLSHPVIAKHIIKHSSFKKQTVDRLDATIIFLQKFVYGDLESVKKVSHALIQIHKKALQDLDVSENEMDEMYKWIHFTTWDSFILGYEATVKKLSTLEKDQLFEEIKIFAELLGIHKDSLPKTFTEFRSYMKEESAKKKVSAEVLEYGNTLMNDPQAWERVLPSSASLIKKYGKDILIRLSYSLIPDNIINKPSQVELLEEGINKLSFSIIKGIFKFLPEKIRYSRAYLRALRRIEGQPENKAIRSGSHHKKTDKVSKCPFARFF